MKSQLNFVGSHDKFEESDRVFRKVYENGYDFFDTAEAYTGVSPDGTVSYNEELVGEAVKGIRDKVVIATKMGVRHNFKGSQDYRAGMLQYTEEGYAKAKELLDMLTRPAAEKNGTMGQLSLAWMINKKPFIVPIPGSRKIERLKENFEAGNIVLPKEEIDMIDSKLDTMSFQVFGGHSAK